jgi:hypothetical protein
MLPVAGAGCRAGVPLVAGTLLLTVLMAACFPSCGGCWP